jgi:hypothetical protein
VGVHKSLFNTTMTTDDLGRSSRTPRDLLIFATINDLLKMDSPDIDALSFAMKTHIPDSELAHDLWFLQWTILKADPSLKAQFLKTLRVYHERKEYQLFIDERTYLFLSWTTILNNTK